MTPAVTIGIDPGLSGAVAAIDTDAGALIWVEDLPVVGPKGRQQVSAPLLADLLRDETITCAVVETVGARPGAGVTGMFRFGCGYGVILGVLGTLGAPVVHVTPAKWKGDMRLTKDKGLSRARAVDRYPGHADRFARVKDDGRAESVLLACWGREAGRG